LVLEISFGASQAFQQTTQATTLKQMNL